LAEVGILLAIEPSERRRGARQQVEIALSSLKRVFGVGEALATTLIGLARRIAAKICAYTYAFYINRCWVVLKGRSRSCGHEPGSTHLENVILVYRASPGWQSEQAKAFLDHWERDIRDNLAKGVETSG
jgi:hypothetical protein